MRRARPASVAHGLLLASAWTIEKTRAPGLSSRPPHAPSPAPSPRALPGPVTTRSSPPTTRASSAASRAALRGAASPQNPACRISVPLRLRAPQDEHGRLSTAKQGRRAARARPDRPRPEQRERDRRRPVPEGGRRVFGFTCPRTSLPHIAKTCETTTGRGVVVRGRPWFTERCRGERRALAPGAETRRGRRRALRGRRRGRARWRVRDGHHEAG